MPQHKLTSTAIRQIKEAIWAGGHQVYVAQAFGVTQGMISQISRGTVHGDVPWPDGSTAYLPYARRAEIQLIRHAQKMLGLPKIAYSGPTTSDPELQKLLDQDPTNPQLLRIANCLGSPEAVATIWAFNQRPVGKWRTELMDKLVQSAISTEKRKREEALNASAVQGRQADGDPYGPAGAAGDRGQVGRGFSPPGSAGGAFTGHSEGVEGLTGGHPDRDGASLSGSAPGGDWLRTVFSGSEEDEGAVGEGGRGD